MLGDELQTVVVVFFHVLKYYEFGELASLKMRCQLACSLWLLVYVLTGWVRGESPKLFKNGKLGTITWVIVFFVGKNRMKLSLWGIKGYGKNYIYMKIVEIFFWK